MKKFLTRLAWRWMDARGYVVLNGGQWATAIGNVQWLESQMRRLQGGNRSKKGTPAETPPVSPAEKQTRRFLVAFKNHLLAAGRPERWRTEL